MKECKACGYVNEETAKFCAKCGTNLDAIVCPNCNIEIFANDVIYCPNCGTNLNEYKHQLWLLDNDKEVKKQDDKYAKLGIWQLICGGMSGIGFFSCYQCLENNWQDSIGVFGLILLALGLPLLIIFSVLRMRKGKQIRKMLNLKSQKCNNTNFFDKSSLM